ncbi:MAG: type II toxin-antitoxin system HicA family toxin [Burkholderiales bacterium]|nr:type II toxin-antitoxin system HicA family toxin [Burkholderiales bacterium]
MPPKIRDLIKELEAAGFVNRGGKGSHRNFVHGEVVQPVTVSGQTGDDAKHYQIRAVRLALKELKSER